MENTIFIVLFVGGFCVFLATMGVDIIRLGLNFVLRCLLGIVVIYLVDQGITFLGGNFVVKINEITIGVSGLFGLSGVFFLFCLQYYFTIT